jgi:hypothetical protein
MLPPATLPRVNGLDATLQPGAQNVFTAPVVFSVIVLILRLAVTAFWLASLFIRRYSLCRLSPSHQLCLGQVNSDMAEMMVFVSLQKLLHYPAGFTFMGDMETERSNDSLRLLTAQESHRRGV